MSSMVIRFWYHVGLDELEPKTMFFSLRAHQAVEGTEATKRLMMTLIYGQCKDADSTPSIASH